jgi:23S rRNA (pseudouridine1915-N3)-methyltransferase
VRFTVVAVGRPRDAALATAIAEYERRAARYWPLSSIEIKEGGAGTRPPAQVRQREGETILERVKDATLVVCDESGDVLSSADFSALMQRWREDARDVAFVIGGAHGVSDDVAAQAKRKLSLAPWTLPHDLARLVLAEQLYRAGSIARGEPYHK